MSSIKAGLLTSTPFEISTGLFPIRDMEEWKPSSQFALGVLFIPRPASGQGATIENVPFQQGREVMLVNVTSTAGTAITALGASYRPSGGLTLYAAKIPVDTNVFRNGVQHDANSHIWRMSLEIQL